MDKLSQMLQSVKKYGSGPLLEEMPRCSLEDKWIAGATAAHRIEEVHTPLNLAYVTFTTGSTAFQNIVGVTHKELEARAESGKLALKLAEVIPGERLIISYPPLVNVFSRKALEDYGTKPMFIERPSRDALLAALCSGNSRCVIGESAFLRGTLIDARRAGISDMLPKGLIIIAAGSPLDMGLVDEASRLSDAAVHDLYGCQEFGWLALDGVPLRRDILLWDDGVCRQLIVGGIAVGDGFLPGSHPLNSRGDICTNTRIRPEAELETTILSAVAESKETVARAARTILRIKGRIVRVGKGMKCGAERTSCVVSAPGGQELRITGPEDTKMLDDLICAQLEYQRHQKSDHVWNKKC